MATAATPDELRDQLAAINDRAMFNQWAGIEVASAGSGVAELRMDWREELGQYSGFLHAGIVTALIDTVCGFAAFTMVGPTLAAHCAVNFLAPAAGDAFVARGRVVKPGRRQVFTAGELFAQRDGELRLVATGETILLTTSES